MGILRFLFSGLAILLAAYLLPGVSIKHYGYALLVALLLSIVNALLKPLLVVLTIPITIVTLGLFLFVINACLILLVDYFISGFQVNGFLWALAFSIILTFFNSILENLTDNQRRKSVRR